MPSKNVRNIWHTFHSSYSNHNIFHADVSFALDTVFYSFIHTSGYPPTALPFFPAYDNTFEVREAYNHTS